MKRMMAPLLPIALFFTLGTAAPADGQQNGSSTPAKDASPPKASAPAKETAAKPYGNADAPENNPALQLTDDQKAKIKAIRDDANQQIQAQVFAVLTPDQQKTWSWEQHEKHEARSQPPKSQ